MSPNGRRAWREWMRKANPRRKLRPPTHSICRLAREGRRHIGPIPPATPKPFTARSLVGMSQSAKRRAARARFVELVLTSQGMEIKPGDEGPRWFHLWCRGSSDVTSRDPDYAALRTNYRIGERLRPCPGCFDCAVECWVCHEPHEPPDELCDGSGVIRAGKLRPLLRKRDCVFYID